MILADTVKDIGEWSVFELDDGGRLVMSREGNYRVYRDHCDCGKRQCDHRRILFPPMAVQSTDPRALPVDPLSPVPRYRPSSAPASNSAPVVSRPGVTLASALLWCIKALWWLVIFIVKWTAIVLWWAIVVLYIVLFRRGKR